MNLSLIISRLAPIRTSERTISVGVLKNPDQTKSDKVLYVIDVPLPTVIGEKVEKAIIDALQNFFGEQSDHSVYRFEETIKQVNVSLFNIAENVNDEWVGHVNAILALWDNNELFVTHAGRMLGAVARGGTLVFIVDPQQTDKKILIHKTFANLTSGQLNDGDTIILGNGEVGRHFSPQFLVSGSNKNDPSQLTQLIQQASRRLNLRYVGAIVARISGSDNDGSEYNLDEAPKIVEEQETSSRVNLPILNQQVKKISKSVNEKIKKLPWNNWKEKAILDSKKLGNLIGEYFKKSFKTIKGPEQPTIEFEDETTSDKTFGIVSQTIRQGSGLEQTEPLYAHSKRHKIRSRANRIYKNWSLKFGSTKKQIKKINPKYLLSLGIVLVLIVIISSIIEIKEHNNKKISSNSTVNQQLDQANKLIQNAKSAINNNQPDQARTELGQAQDFINKATLNDPQSGAVMTAQNQLNDILDPLNNITAIDTSNPDTVPENTVGIAVIDQYIFSYQANSGKIYRQTVGQTNDDQIIYSTADNGAITDMVSLPNSKQLIVATNKNHLYRVYVNGITGANQLIPPNNQSWANIQSMTTYLNNIYILEKSTGQIWKYVSSDGTHYTEKQAYFSSASLANQASIDIATDGDMYVLDKSGNVSKFTLGNLQTYGPMTIPLPNNSFNNPQHILTDTNSTSIWVQDNNRLIEFSKTGQYVRQFTFSGGNLSACSLSYGTKQAWVLSGTQLYSIPL